MANRSKHDNLVETILKNPQIVGLEDILSAETEVGCVDNGFTICMPDIVFEYGSGELAIVEVKSNCTGRSLNKLYDQLRKGFYYFLRKYRKRCRTIGAYLAGSRIVSVEYKFRGEKDGEHE